MEISDKRELCRRIVEQAHAAILFFDHGGIIRLWNQGCELEKGGCPSI